MKQLRITARVDPDRAPAFFDLLANSPEIPEARVLDWNATPEDVETVLFAIDGDPAPFAAAAETPSVESVELSATTGGRTYALAVVRPLVTPMFRAILRARTRSKLLVRKPIVYRDGRMLFRVVGDPEPLQRALDETPDGIDVRIDGVRSLHPGVDDPVATLSDRQRAAVEAALGLGYYDQPRGATHADVAAELGCAPATASDHLRTAEAKLVRAAMDEFRSGGR